MCGIAGFLGAPDPQLLRRMCDSLVHRGPDDSGYYEHRMASLAMRRLSIIDLKTGHQPISNETGDVWVVFNGEIYNFESVRQELLEAGHSFQTASDTEVIVHAYEEFGLDFVKRLRGMFGIAIWDEPRQRAVLVRDRIGEKPLFYSQSGNRLLFGSEIKAVLQGVSSRSVDSQAVCDYLSTGYVTAPRTFFQEIRKVAPGEMLVVENGQLSSRQYWRYPQKDRRSTGYKEACEIVENELLGVTKLCLKSDVEVAAFLSGGLDSSIIVAMMKQHEAEIQTFSVGYEGKASGFNELGFAQQVSQHVGTQHHELILDAKSNIELLPEVIFHFDEPHGEPTSLLVHLLCEFVQKQVKVALGGTGGDELFFGYPRHAGLRYLQWYSLIPGWLRRQLIERAAALLPELTRGGNFTKRVKRFVSGASDDPDQAYLRWIKLLNTDLLSDALSSNVASLADDERGDQFVRSILLDSSLSPELLDRVARVDITGYLPEYQLTYMDRMSMANSLEVRSPLCDYRLVEIVAGLPNNYRIDGTRTKRILKDVAKRYLPDNIVNRRKVGFDSPIGQWFKDELRPFITSFLAPQQIEQSGLLDPDTVQAMLVDHWEGRRNYSLQLWSIVSLEAWYRMYIEDQIDSLDGYELRSIRGVPKGLA
jgi:asparagine synthase (glutamine-hydrolysing)